VNTSAQGVPVGWTHCFGCGFNNNWNEMARLSGWSQIPKGSAKEIARIAPNAGLRMSQMKREMLGDTTSEPEWETVDPWLAKRLMLDFDMDWRTIPNKLLRKLGAKRVIAQDGLPFVVIPVRMRKQLVGIVRGRWIKSEDKRQRSYINSKGRWVKKQGLLGYDLAIKTKLYKKHRFLILVEGPRDALVLLSHGIPAMSILGNNWSQEKLEYLIDLEPKLIVSLMDNDDSGRKLGKQIRQDCKTRHVTCLKIDLPHEDDIGYKLDPATLTAKQEKQIINHILSKLGLRR
jgi:5S rRNA maturation endonuclease (ribonuclease M5)